MYGLFWKKNAPVGRSGAAIASGREDAGMPVSRSTRIRQDRRGGSFGAIGDTYSTAKEIAKAITDRSDRCSTEDTLGPGSQISCMEAQRNREVDRIEATSYSPEDMPFRKDRYSTGDTTAPGNSDGDIAAARGIALGRIGSASYSPTYMPGRSEMYSREDTTSTGNRRQIYQKRETGR